MSNELSRLQNQLWSERNRLGYLQTENNRHISNYDAGLIRIQQLEQDLMDTLQIKSKMVERFHELENLVYGKSSKLGRLEFVQSGRLEGRFFVKLQTQIDQERRSYERMLEIIRDEIEEVMRKANMIESELEAERSKVMHLDTLISTNRTYIQQTKVQISQLESRIRVLT